ncbi:hypothetical protein FHG87_005956, partial [Trinorchestia longiramus]
VWWGPLILCFFTATLSKAEKFASLDDPTARIVEAKTKDGTRIVLLVADDTDDFTKSATIEKRRAGPDSGKIPPPPLYQLPGEGSENNFVSPLPLEDPDQDFSAPSNPQTSGTYFPPTAPLGSDDPSYIAPSADGVGGGTLAQSGGVGIEHGEGAQGGGSIGYSNGGSIDAPFRPSQRLPSPDESYSAPGSDLGGADLRIVINGNGQGGFNAGTNDLGPGYSAPTATGGFVPSNPLGGYSAPSSAPASSYGAPGGGLGGGVGSGFGGGKGGSFGG